MVKKSVKCEDLCSWKHFQKQSFGLFIRRESKCECFDVTFTDCVGELHERTAQVY